MRHASLPLLLLLALVVGAADVRAQAAPQVGSCTLGRAEAALDINNIFGAVFNTGSLFFGNTLTNGDGYLAPKTTGNSPIFASGIWIGGRVGGQLRVAGARYTNFNFWPGPLDAATGRPVNPASCAAYDRIYSVTRDDIRGFENGGQFSDDLTEWPAALGAPVIDGDGNPNNYDLGAGDRPEIIGDQGIWWVMNDVGNAHIGSNTPPLGVEVQVLAFAFARADALGSTTFYRYRIINKSGSPINQTYVSVFSDPDLGGAVDDYVGSDTAAGLGYVYNADNSDSAYGAAPPAVGYDFFQGPIVPDGPDAGTGRDTLGTSAFSYFINGGSIATTDPTPGTAIYAYQQGLWADNTEMRALGNGYAQPATAPVTKFAFPGDPVTGQAWSEVNNGTAVPVNAPGDRRLVVHTGPFTMNNGDVQDIVFGIVYARGASNLGSITALRSADRLAQRAYDIRFDLPAPPPAPQLCDANNPTILPGSGNCLEVTAQSGQLTLNYGYASSSPNFLGQYEVINKFIQGQGFADVTYNFEGFNIYRYPTADFASDQRELIQTFDVVNGVREVRDQVFDPTIGDNNVAILARGTDSGLSYSFNVTGLTNFTDYYYGITAYAYNENSSPKIIESQPTFITGRPSGLTGGVSTQSTRGDTLGVTVISQRGEGSVNARVIDPTRITGATYEVRFFHPTNADGTISAITTYSIVNTTTGAVAFDGQDHFARTGEALPGGQNIAIIDGFEFDIAAPQPGFKDFLTTANSTGLLTPPEDGALDPNHQGFPNPSATSGDDFQTPLSPRQQPTTTARWGIHTACNSTVAATASADLCNYATSPTNFLTRTLRLPALGNLTALGVNDYEIRFTGTNNFAYVHFSSPRGLIQVPFQIWDTGVDRTTAADDVRLFPILNEWGATATTTAGNLTFDLGADHPTSGGLNDPQTDWIYWYRPTVVTPGQAGYNAAVAAVQAEGTGYSNTFTGLQEEVMARMVLASFNNGNAYSGTFLARLPETGTVFQIQTAKPNQAGDTFAINTADLQTSAPTAEGQEAALDRIAAVPNPYLGQSNYETGNLSRVIRFTNLPEQTATIRIYTVSGSLVQTLRKDGASRSLDWDLQTSNNLPVASGMYLVHVDVEGVGERTLKLGVINRRTQITVF